MSPTFLVIIIAIIALGLMVLGLSITIIRKGRYMQTEVGENDEMKKRGLKCTSEEFRREEAELSGTECDTLSSCGGSCGTCNDKTTENVEK